MPGHRMDTATPAATTMPKFWMPCSPGDLADRWSILNLKLAKASTPEQREACQRLLHALPWPGFDETAMGVVHALQRVNQQLWDLEDDVRALMAGEQTDDAQRRFVEAARKIPLLNDTRAHLRTRIDELTGHTPGDLKVYRG